MIMTLDNLLLFTVAAPGALFLLLALGWLMGIELRERTVARLTNMLFALTTVASAWMGFEMFSNHLDRISWFHGSWFDAGEYHFELSLIADRLSLPLILLTSILVGLVGIFSRRYMHRERGFLRFFLLMHLFAFGALLLFAAGSFDLLIGGWELVGITSVLLVAFFQQRPGPVSSAVYVFTTYRIGDLGLLLGVFVLHSFAGTSNMLKLFPGNWPEQSDGLSTVGSVLAGALFLFAASAKSAQVPFSGWLPRAMEGPTPSSAIFYGAISVHAGAYLLLRVAPVWSASGPISIAVVAVGALGAILGTLAHRVAVDAKSSIAYAAMTQLGIIFVEIGLGFPRIALAHIVGHSVVRTLQFLRAPSMLHDYHRVHAAAGGELGRTGDHFDRMVPAGLQRWAYRFALDCGFYDAAIMRFAVAPIVTLSNWLGSFEPGVTASKSRGARQPTGLADEAEL
jgi:NAD(P)H-quinone oxidoreductase subunit 5